VIKKWLRVLYNRPQVFKFVSVSLVKAFWGFVISVDNSRFIQRGSLHRTVVGRNGIIKFNPVVIMVSKREDLPSQETTLSNILGIYNSSKYFRNANRELGRKSLFHTTNLCTIWSWLRSFGFSCTGAHFTGWPYNLCRFVKTRSRVFLPRANYSYTLSRRYLIYWSHPR
jgi:hypothetical protein